MDNDELKTMQTFSLVESVSSHFDDSGDSAAEDFHSALLDQLFYAKCPTFIEERRIASGSYYKNDQAASSRTVSKKKKKKSKWNPSLAQQVKCGTYNTICKGKWTHAEHLAFLNAVKVHGKNWVAVSKAMKKRTVLQVRTHAQKFFIKVKAYLERHNLDVPQGLASTAMVDSKSVTALLFRKNTLVDSLAYNISFCRGSEKFAKSPLKA